MAEKKKNTFRKILRYALLAVLAGALVYGYIIIDDIASNILGKQLMVKKDADAVNRILSSMQAVGSDLSYIIEYSHIDEQMLRDVMTSMIRQNAAIYGCKIAFEPYEFYKDSIYFCRAYSRNHDSIIAKPADEQYIYWDWYQIPKEQKKIIWSEPYFDKEHNRTVASCCVPLYRIRDDEEVFRGILTLDIDLTWIDEKFFAGRVHPSGFSAMMSRNGRIVYASNRHRDWELNETIFSIGEEQAIPGYRKFGREAIQGLDGMMEVEDSANNKYLLIAAPIRTSQWSYFMIFRYAEYTSLTP